MKGIEQLQTLLNMWTKGAQKQHPAVHQVVLWVCAGDCRAVLCRNGTAVVMSRDHTADDPDERQRVQAAGGAVKNVGDGWRIGDAGLQVTR